MKVSFDFDSTLDRGDVQHLVKEITRKHEVEIWVVTSRVPDHKAPSINWNNDLWFVCKELDIPRDRVIFTSYSSKHEFFWDKDFIFHLDDDPDEIKMIKATCPTIPINHMEDPQWKEKIYDLLELFG